MTQRRDTGPSGAAPGGATNPRAGGIWDSALSSEEYAAVKGAGFEPVGQVLGTTVVAIGYGGVGGCPGAWTVQNGKRVPFSRWVQSLSGTARSIHAARTLALSRAAAECGALGGDGIVGVELDVRRFPEGFVEYSVRGTAVRARSRVRPHRPFTSHLTGQDFAKLLYAGWVPTGLAFGIALEIRHDDWRTSRRTAWTADNQEVDGHTQLLGHVRREARRHLTLDAAKHGGDGLVVDDVELTVSESECSSYGYARDFIAEAVFVGTSIARFGRSGRSAGPAPLTMMRLERER
ncbi:heavy metal-binding domain-containing protein [Streptomyces sp. Isolate_45]|uniref:heavy metal-binding domain-containing protein n=1 Tax=Streptomyces sp. Isolate_45 TaxID=2950111 RepID=UPI0024820AB7|nr:heavy metal-binding domain-containing protein [Streptomyces sp. Isolate_45]MDA5283333.1 heavy metal-binding domain-containing protein [Streptomyces sp. Isolate_45]